MAVKKGLGRGLDMLIPREDKASHKEKENTDNQIKEESRINEEDIKEYDIEIDIRKIEPNRNQPRKQFDEDAIEELAESIKQFGVIQPLIVKKKGDYYEIIAGERRWRAAKIAGLKEIPIIVRDISQQEVMEISLIENIQRENLNPIEEALAYKRLL